MASPVKDELYLPQRTHRPVGLFGATVRALAVMAVLDVALMLVWDDGESTPVPAIALEAPPAQADTDPLATAPPGEAVAAVSPSTQEEPAIQAPETDIAATEPHVPTAAAEPHAAPTAAPELSTAAATAAPELPTAQRDGDPAGAEASTETIAVFPPTAAPVKLAEPIPVPALPPTQPIPAAVKLTVEPPVHVVLPSTKPRPPASFRAKPVRRAAPHARHEPEAPAARSNILQTAAAPGAIAPPAGPPPCRPYSAATTLDGNAWPVRGIACPGPDGTWRIITERASLD